MTARSAVSLRPTESVGIARSHPLGTSVITSRASTTGVCSDMRSLAFYSLAALYTVFDVAANVMLKRWLDGHGARWFAFAMAVYVCCGASWAASLKFKEFYKAQLIYSPISLVCGILITYAVGSGHEITLRNWIGIGLAVLAIALIDS